MILIEKFVAYWNKVEKKGMPTYAWTADPLTFWRERILFLMCFICSGLGFVALIPSLALAYKEGLWGVIAMDFFAWLMMVCALLLRGLPLKVRGGIAFFSLYGLGIGLSFALGPVGAGYIWLFGASVMASTIIGMGASIGALILNMITLLCVGVYILIAMPSWAETMENAFGKWMVTALNFMLFNSFVTITTAFMLNGLRQALGKELQISADLRKSEERYRIVADFNYDWEYWIGPQGVLRYVSPSCERITGFKAEEFMQNSDLLATIVHQEDMARTSTHLKADTIKNNAVGSIDFRIVRSDGQIKWISHSCLPVYSDENEYLGRRVSNRDITDRKVIEDKLRLHHERFLTVLDSIDASIYVADLDTYEILFMNKHMIESYGEDLTGRVCWQAFKNESAPSYWCNNQELLDENLEPTGVHTWQEQNPVTLKWYVNHDRAIRWTDGRLAKIQIATDITELKKLETELRQSHKMEAIGTLAGGIAHDFNNILSAVIGYTEMALDDHLPPESKARDNLENVLKAGSRARELVKQILAFSRQTQYEKQPIALTPVIKECLKLLQASLPANIEIRNTFAAKDLRITGDPTHIHQVMMNLCTNAAYAMRNSGGILAVHLETVEIGPEQAEASQIKPGPYIELTVSDNGPGMPQSVLTQVFDPFFTTKPKEEGTGLGLSVVHGIVTDHQGMIDVDSRPGRGTTFHVYLPQLTDAKEDTYESDAPLPMGSERILVIDDEPAVVATHKAFLEKLGYSVTTMTDSQKAIAYFAGDPMAVDLIVTDQTMPKLTGDKLALKALKIRPKMPVVLCTGFSHAIDEPQAKSLGIREFLYKPVLRKDLAHAVRRALDQKG